MGGFAGSEALQGQTLKTEYVILKDSEGLLMTN